MLDISAFGSPQHFKTRFDWPRIIAHVTRNKTNNLASFRKLCISRISSSVDKMRCSLFP